MRPSNTTLQLDQSFGQLLPRCLCGYSLGSLLPDVLTMCPSCGLEPSFDESARCYLDPCHCGHCDYPPIYLLTPDLTTIKVEGRETRITPVTRYDTYQRGYWVERQRHKGKLSGIARGEARDKRRRFAVWLRDSCGISDNSEIAGRVGVSLRTIQRYFKDIEPCDTNQWEGRGIQDGDGTNASSYTYWS